MTIAVASSGIAATLIDGGKTAHSTFKIPLNISNIESPTCNIEKNSEIANKLLLSNLIIWDESPMSHKKCFEALNRTLMDICSNNQIFGGKTVLLSGDFRQLLPVIPRSTAADELNACLKHSYLWKYINKLYLSSNMRSITQNNSQNEEFQNNLLSIGNGTIKKDEITHEIEFPKNFGHMSESVQHLIQNVYPNIKKNYTNYNWLEKRSILATTNEAVNKINYQILNKIPGELFEYTSIDSMIDNELSVHYPTEFLNSLEPSGLPPHKLKLKKGCPIMLIRNLNAPKLCNGTRMVITHLTKNIIEAEIIGGNYSGERVLIPRIPMQTTDLSFEFRRLQFPIKIAFAITINKSQGQTLDTVGIILVNPCFSHGQLYVACSRTGNPNNLYIFAPNNKTKNVVYPLALL